MISILMATYNGERFIKEQIESLLEQTVSDYKLYISDDNSTDSTYEIAQGYARKHPEKIFVSQNENNLGGAKQNFIQMMITHIDEYIMLCDQDDVWLPGKIEKSLHKMKELEDCHGISKPILIYTDLNVVDENLNVISTSYFKTEDINNEKKTLNKIVARNITTGCTVMYNRALADLINVTPEHMIMHDWWLTLIACAFGELGTIYEPTILYRQHSDNEIGIVKVKTLSHMLHKLINYKEAKRVLNDTYAQAASLLKIYNDKLSNEQKEFLNKFCDIPNHNKINRWILICRLGVLKKGILRKISSFIFI